MQIDMLLGKAYSDWGHIGDAVAVYNSLIAAHPNDFRGYLAKVIHFNGLLILISVTTNGERIALWIKFVLQIYY